MRWAGWGCAIGDFTSSNTTLQMLGDTLKYAAPVASSAGASIEEVAAMAGLLGMWVSRAAWRVRRYGHHSSGYLLPKMAADALANLGVEVKDLDGNLRPVPELLKELAQATEDSVLPKELQLSSKYLVRKLLLE